MKPLFEIRHLSAGILQTAVCFVLFFCGPSIAQLPDLIGVLQGEPNTLLGWEVIGIGDQNDDGYDDILVFDWRDYPLPQVWRAKLFFGGPTLDTVADLTIGDSIYGSLSNLDDIDGDGFPDFSSETVAGSLLRAMVYWGGPANDGVHDLWFGTDTLQPRGRAVRGYDLDQDGSDELVWGANGGQAFLVFSLEAPVDSAPYRRIAPPDSLITPGYQFADRVVAGDFDGNGRVDIAVNMRAHPAQNLNGQVYLYFGGPDFDTIPDLVIRRPGEYSLHQDMWGDRMACVGDYNGDGFDDLYVGTHPSSDTTAHIYFGGPGLDTLPDIVIPGKADFVAPAGDVNDDGYDDFIRGYPLPFAGAGYAEIFLGGPEADSVWDVRIHNASIPGLQYEVGRSCTGIGDFNGDGIDDFAFSAEGSSNEGLVYIYAGWSGSLDVEYEYDPKLPGDYTLFQNYPNPFNASTQIEFGLPLRSHVRLTVYNILGKEVRVLVEDELSAGSYRVEWDGRDGHGDPVASGVYLCKLSSGESVKTRKMLLLK